MVGNFIYYCSFSLLIFIPIYYFVLNGASTVYEGIRLYHPYLFYFKNSEILLFYVIIQLAVLGQVFLINQHGI